MDTITHTLFGLAIYGAIDKSGLSKQERRAYLITAVGASQIPDIDVISKLWDQEGLYQMWHRGITHSVFLTPVWAGLFLLLSRLLFKTGGGKLFLIAWAAVLIHNTSDLFNAWGTGYLEPFSTMRVTFGTIPIVDLVFWVIIGGAFIAARKNRTKAPRYFRGAWVLIGLHVLLQSTQGYILYQQYSQEYDQVALSAEFVPWTFSVITKSDDTVSIYGDGLFKAKEKLISLTSAEDADLEQLFSKRPEAKTLYEWSPFVVVVNDDTRIGIYDPRFYRNGQSFLFEYIEKTQR
ncbi:metal-dependent hydrolase [Mesobacillus harenae]|uniref:metal-dependent hydrolase n=1 Tax=Mesobacillus harenae TaxID=2213203 RepID=UPI0015801B9E|nr:metal-dependent hydrolase [Mesobacillus harenae]